MSNDLSVPRVIIGRMGDSREEHQKHSKVRKGFAQVRGRPPRNPAFFVGDSDDWEIIKYLGKGQLICHQPGCSVAFQKPKVSSRGLRYLAAMPGHSCAHGLARPDLGGGPMSPQHLWLQNRIAKIIRGLRGFRLEPVIEHRESRSDVFVPGPNLAIEVQRWSTEFEARTLARQRKGHQVLWLVTEDNSGRKTKDALFRLPAVRVSVRSRKDPYRKLEPWKDPRQERDAILMFSATIAHPIKTGRLKTWPVRPHRFLSEIINGRRQWFPPGTPGLPRSYNGAWVLRDDLDRLSQRR